MLPIVLCELCAAVFAEYCGYFYSAVVGKGAELFMLVGAGMSGTG